MVLVRHDRVEDVVHAALLRSDEGLDIGQDGRDKTGAEVGEEEGNGGFIGHGGVSPEVLVLLL